MRLQQPSRRAIAHQSWGIPDITAPSQNGTASGNLGHAMAINDSVVTPESPPPSIIGAAWGDS
ncbi:MAG: hypothetical protein AAFY20_00495 [Cyanobacteria bacterium J06639_14]